MSTVRYHLQGHLTCRTLNLGREISAGETEETQQLLQDLKKQLKMDLPMTTTESVMVLRTLAPSVARQMCLIFMVAICRQWLEQFASATSGAWLDLAYFLLCSVIPQTVPAALSDCIQRNASQYSGAIFLCSSCAKS